MVGIIRRVLQVKRDGGGVNCLFFGGKVGENLLGGGIKGGLGAAGVL